LADKIFRPAETAPAGRISRRGFLQVVATGAAAAAASSLLGGCDAPAPVRTRPAPVTSPPDAAYLAVARGGDDPEALVERAIAALGGIGRFVPAGSAVVIKPNICTTGRSYEYAATTNPWVVGALVKLCRSAGAARVAVLDYPFGGTSDQAYQDSGIQEQTEAAGGTMVPISMIRFLPTAIPDAVRLQTCDIFDEVLNADVLINVPIAKNHGLARITMGMKNLLGVVRDRPVCHGDLAGTLPDLTGYLRPTLTILDAVRILTANGPTGGSLDDVRKLDTVVAGADPVAVDSYGATLFGLDGPEDLPYIAAAAQRGIGRSDWKNLKIEEIPVGG
jgi:uncharacterized protein (DUF362 family)